MITWSAIRVLRDFLLLAVFMHAFLASAGARVRTKPALCLSVLVVSYAIMLTFTVGFGRDGVLSLGLWLVPTKIVVFTVVSYAILHLVFNLSRRISILESLIFSLTLRVCQMLYTEVFSALVISSGAASFGFFLTTEFETVFVGLEGVLLLLVLAPGPDETADANVSHLQIVLLVFVLLDYIVIRLAYNADATSTWTIVADAFECICIFVFCYVIKQMVIYNANRNRMSRMNALVESQYANMLQRQRDDQRIRTIHHDLKHAVELLKSREGTEAQRYVEVLDGLDNTIQSMRCVPYTSNVILNMVLNNEAEEAEARSIRFDIQVNIGDCAFMDDYDIVTIFGNVCSNALEAVEKIEDKQKRWVVFEATQSRSTLLFRISNPYEVQLVRRRNGTLATTKTQDPTSHGLGLSSIRDNAERYGGNVRFDDDGGVFELTVSIPVPVSVPESAASESAPTEVKQS